MPAESELVFPEYDLDGDLDSIGENPECTTCRLYSTEGTFLRCQSFDTYWEFSKHRRDMHPNGNLTVEKSPYPEQLHIELMSRIMSLEDFNEDPPGLIENWIKNLEKSLEKTPLTELEATSWIRTFNNTWSEE